MKKKKSKSNTIIIIIIVLLIFQLVKLCHRNDWLNQSKPNTDPKKIEELIKKLQKD